MWRYAFLNFCFLMLALILLTLQHSSLDLGSVAHGWALGDTAESVDRDMQMNLRAPASFSLARNWLDQTWQRVKIFDEWLMEYNTSQWEIFRASSPIETDLLQARYHVANAEVFTEAMSEKNRALKELDRAAGSLQAAQPLLDRKLAPQLATIRSELAAAERTEPDRFSTLTFETIKADLDRLLQTLRVSQT